MKKPIITRHFCPGNFRGKAHAPGLRGTGHEITVFAGKLILPHR
jgi:hypothetical protein